jgi:hypothetical protein
VLTDGIAALVLNGLAGDDLFTLNGPLAFPITVDGGEPSASDVLEWATAPSLAMAPRSRWRESRL